ncbi:aspartyl/asparaginyl beta-hydroxylase domain-containing protein [Aquisediminimonas profunda]|uniref:aspartyl/asparaginyl beta-hydroxylase domain-containing protein n=1 Tax=Aquisediminimonas profunda TaxID=1550733 RepID=UPI001C626CC2|nr:aspartyl/asparaginyl beta-hydroxylase domain-containing protein [Aquisediminimonas profunda]
MNDLDCEAIARSGVEALRRGDASAARSAFSQVEAAGRASHQLRLLLAQSCELMGDGTAMEAALAPVLEAEPRNIYALLMMGENRARMGDDRAASSWFNLALSSAAHAANLPPDLPPRLDRAVASLKSFSRKFEDHLQARLAATNIDPDSIGSRFREGIEILAGRAQPQLQQPTSFYYPRLPQIPFYDPAGFNWVPALEAKTSAIRVEAEAVLSSGRGLAPYVQRNVDRPSREHALLDDPDWSAYYLWRDGALDADHARACPATVAALEGLPMPSIADRSPAVLFSVLRPKTHIPPHWGMLNTRLICHLPLIVPPDCRLRVGNETRTVEAGKMLIFDDSIEHEAWNDSDETRVILLFEIWRPELDAKERGALTAMFESIALY